MIYMRGAVNLLHAMRTSSDIPSNMLVYITNRTDTKLFKNMHCWEQIHIFGYIRFWNFLYGGAVEICHMLPFFGLPAGVL